MIDVQAREITERDLEAALKLAHPEVCLIAICFKKIEAREFVHQ